MIIAEAMGSGVPGLGARAIAGSVAGAVTAAGSTLATATTLLAANNHVTAGSGGVILPPSPSVGDTICVGNGLGTTLSVYPHVAGAKINNGSAGAAVSVAAGKGGEFICMDSLNWMAIYS